MRVVLRELGTVRTHLADVESTSAALRWNGRPYRKTPPTATLCAAKILVGEALPDSTRLTCRSCAKHL